MSKIKDKSASCVKYTIMDYEKAIKLYQKGLNPSEISRLMPVNRKVIYDWVHGNSKPLIMRLEEWRQKNRYSPQLIEWFRQIKLGPLNPMWKGNNIKIKSGRARAQRRFLVPQGYDRHHLDGNARNNASENIAVVTRREHMILDGRMARRNQGGKFF